MSVTIANLCFENDEAYNMVSTLDVKRPAIDQLKPVEGEKDVDKSRQ
jgi:hypothetical protein